MYKNTGRDENGYAVYEDTAEKTAEQIEAEKAFNEWIANYEKKLQAR